MIKRIFAFIAAFALCGLFGFPHEGKVDTNKLRLIVKAVVEGGKGSGNWGHESVGGKRGGSKAGTGGLDKYIKGDGQVDNLDNAVKEYGKIFSNWKQEKAEKMVLVAKDGQYIVVGSGDKGAG